ncbi:hypothetical protein [Paracoccus indicus]|uniref:hypothetical protein n=1 Tax=Paracoccus indicus TaxID=2079229 RepID=UPI0013B3DF77|nr:hypothetical protein [Paracoccus indicus]
MAFICAVDEDADQVEITVSISDEDAYARICLGHDDLTGAIYSVLVDMPRYLPEPNGRDVHFTITEVVFEDGEQLEYAHRDGLETRFLDKKARRVALSCIITAIAQLASELNPDTIVMTTITPHLPPKALGKYWAVCKAMNEMGYVARRDSPFHGTQIWIMNRITDET